MLMKDLYIFDSKIDRTDYVKQHLILAAERLGLGVKVKPFLTKIYIFSPSLNSAHDSYVRRDNTGECALLVINNNSTYTLYTKPIVIHYSKTDPTNCSIILTEPKQSHIYDLIDGDQNHFYDFAKDMMQRLEKIEASIAKSGIQGSKQMLLDQIEREAHAVGE